METIIFMPSADVSHGAVCVSVYLCGFVSFLGVLLRVADGLTYYLCRCQGGNWRQPLPKAPAHHCPVHNNFSREAVTQSVIICLHRLKLQLNSQIQEFLVRKGRRTGLFYLKCMRQLLTSVHTGSQHRHRKPQEKTFVNYRVYECMHFLNTASFSVFDIILSKSKGNESYLSVKYSVTISKQSVILCICSH